MSPTLTQETKALAELELRPEVRARLEACLSTYTEYAEQIELLTELADLEKSKIGKLLADHGYDKVKTSDETSLTWVRGSTTSTLDKMKLMAAGVTQAMIEACTVVKPRKDYFQIRRKSVKAARAEE